jgi:hypothetical protein
MVIVVFADPPCNAIAIAIAKAIAIAAHCGLFALFGVFFGVCHPLQHE